MLTLNFWEVSGFSLQTLIEYQYSACRWNMNPTSSLYEQDYYLWMEKTIHLLETRQFSELDLENLIDEISDMASNKRKAIKSNLAVILWHLLKYKYEPGRRSNSWRLTLLEHRDRIEEDLKESPSLKPFIKEIFDECYQKARRSASTETGLKIDIFPKESPFTLEEALNLDYLPESED
jgi:hypothetical protein